MQSVTTKVQRIRADDWHMLGVIGQVTDRSSRKDVLTAVIRYYCKAHRIDYRTRTRRHERKRA